MFCFYCHNNIPDGVKSCIYCGAPTNSGYSTENKKNSRKSKKGITIVLVCVLSAVLIFAAVLAAQYFTNNGLAGELISPEGIIVGYVSPASDFEYEENDDGNITILRYIGASSNVVIPQAIEDKPVTKIYRKAFTNCVTVKSVVIPEGVILIAAHDSHAGPIPKDFIDGTFANCTSLESVTIPNSAKYIGQFGTFRNCTSLKNITIPDGIRDIECFAFQGCTKLENINFSNSVTYISGSSFDGCTSLKHIAIPENVTKIDSEAFKNCTSLEEIIIPQKVTEITWGVFSNCTSLKSITLSPNVTSIGHNAFENCIKLERIDIPDSVTEIKSSAFVGCNITVTAPHEQSYYGRDSYEGVNEWIVK